MVAGGPPGFLPEGSGEAVRRAGGTTARGSTVFWFEETDEVAESAAGPRAGRGYPASVLVLGRDSAGHPRFAVVLPAVPSQAS